LIGGTASTSPSTASDQVSSSADTDGSYYVIREGETEQFTITVVFNPDLGTTALIAVELDSVRFDPDNAADGASTDDTTYTVPDTEDVETDPISIDVS
jgi:hypothetical protein